MSRNLERVPMRKLSRHIRKDDYGGARLALDQELRSAAVVNSNGSQKVLLTLLIVAVAEASRDY